mgnify:CR=1 FL=1
MNGGAPERSFERALERPAQRGRRAPMGVTALQVEGRPGLNAVVHAPHARAVWLCLFSPDGRTETQRLRLYDEGGLCETTVGALVRAALEELK